MFAQRLQRSLVSEVRTFEKKRKWRLIILITEEEHKQRGSKWPNARRQDVGGGGMFVKFDDVSN